MGSNCVACSAVTIASVPSRLIVPRISFVCVDNAIAGALFLEEIRVVFVVEEQAVNVRVNMTRDIHKIFLFIMWVSFLQSLF